MITHPTFRDHYLLDAVTFDCCELVRSINSAYLNADYSYVRSFPFVAKVYEVRSSLRRRHIPKPVRADVLSVGKCAKCGTTERLTIDHIHPVSRGGSDDRGNLQALCLTCNIRKLNHV